MQVISSYFCCVLNGSQFWHSAPSVNVYLSVWLSVALLPSCLGARPEKYESRGKLARVQSLGHTVLGFELCYV